MRINNINVEIIVERLYKITLILISFDMESLFPSLKRFTKLSFQNGEYSLDLVSLMILFLIERVSNSSSIMFGYSFSFPFSDTNKRT